MDQSHDSKKYKTKKKKNLKWLWGVIGALLIIFFLGGSYIFSGLPSLEELENPTPVLASKVYGIDGELVGQFFIENRIEVPLDSIPEHLKEALIATEDRKFYSHWGVDLDRFVKAMVKNVISFSMGEGASTITQQLAKNLYSLKERNESVFGTIIRKIREWITAIQIEKTYTKDEILEMYLNISYFGKGAYGIQTASRTYFGKDISDVELKEAAVLVALLKSSVIYDPSRRYDNAFRRRNVVMFNMVDAGFLDRERYDKLKKDPIVLTDEKIKSDRSLAPHFMEYVRRQATAIAKRNGFDLYKDGLNIYTTIDTRMQKVANKVVREHIDAYQKLFNKHWNWEKQKTALNAVLDKAIKRDSRYSLANSKEDKNKVYIALKNNKSFVDSVKKVEETIEVGFVAIDPTNGHIRAMVGGSNYDFAYGLNHVTGIKRQPGSSFKPIIYAAAIDNGLYPQFPLLNQPFDYNGWSPQNSDESTGDYTTLREGLTSSLNIITARLIIENHVQLDQIGELAKKMGINSKLYLQPSIALGTSEVTPLEMVSAYATLANKGIHISPISILRVEDKSGITIEKFYSDEVIEALSPETAAIVTDMMQSVVDSGTGAGVRRYFHRPAAAKTGTTQDFSDAWFVGFTPQLAAGAWVGFDDMRVRFTDWYGQGAKAAGPIWAKFMAGVYEELNLPLKYFDLPQDVINVEFCEETIRRGNPKLANEYCPVKKSDLVIKGNEPEECDIHQGGSIWPF